MVIKLTPRKIVLSVFVLFLLASALLFAPSAIVTSTRESRGIKLPIIMYHHISSNKGRLNAYVVTPEQFESDIKFIKDKGYTTINMTQLINHQLKGDPLPEKPIIISFDDGYESTYVYAYPALKKYDMCAVVSIVGFYTDTYTKVEDHNIGYSHMNWSEVEELSKTKTIEFQNHSYNMHKQSGDRIATKKKYGESADQYRKALNGDLGKMQDLMYQKIGVMPNTFTYPYGSNSELSKKILLEMGFTAALTCESRVNIINQNTDLMKLGRFNRPHGKTSEQFFANIIE
ncbi:MAG: polysaccharide deacetylase family protein [Oscillospiraceae bacterium]